MGFNASQSLMCLQLLLLFETKCKCFSSWILFARMRAQRSQFPLMETPFILLELACAGRAIPVLLGLVHAMRYTKKTIYKRFMNTVPTSIYTQAIHKWYHPLA